MANSLIEAVRDKIGHGIQNLIVNQSPAKVPELMINLIHTKSQVRKEFENDGNLLSELAEDIKTRGIIQPILVRPIEGGKYELVAGERRLQAAQMVGLKTIPALVRVMNDDEAEQAQFIENIQRKNLTLQEQAQRVQKDLDACGGNIEIVLKKYGKPKSGRAWIYKIRGLLNLSKQAQRLITENITADIEVINDIRQIEKVSASKAEETVNKLKLASNVSRNTDRGRIFVNKHQEEKKKKGNTGDMREISRSMKARLVPSKRHLKKLENKQDTTIEITGTSTQKMTEEACFLPRSLEDVPDKLFSHALFFSWLDKIGKGEELIDIEKAGCMKIEKSLRGFFEKGTKTKDWVTEIAQGIRQKRYDNSTLGMLNLVAFSAGFSDVGDFSIRKIIDKAKNLSIL